MVDTGILLLQCMSIKTTIMAIVILQKNRVPLEMRTHVSFMIGVMKEEIFVSDSS